MTYPARYITAALSEMDEKYGCGSCREFARRRCKPGEEPCRYAYILDQFDSYEAYDAEMLRNCQDLLAKILKDEEADRCT